MTSIESFIIHELTTNDHKQRKENLNGKEKLKKENGKN